MKARKTVGKKAPSSPKRKKPSAPLDRQPLAVLFSYMARLDSQEKDPTNPDSLLEREIMQACIDAVTMKVAQTQEELGKGRNVKHLKAQYIKARNFVAENYDKLEKEENRGLREELASILELETPEAPLEKILEGFKKAGAREDRGGMKLAMCVVGALKGCDAKTIWNHIDAKSRSTGPHRAASRMFNPHGYTAEFLKKMLGMSDEDWQRLIETSLPKA